MAVPVTLRALTSASGMRRALVAYTVFSLVEMSMWIAVVLYAFAQGGASLAGIAAVVQLVPSALIAPVIAGMAERLPRGRALVLTYLLVMVTCAWVTAALAADAGPWWVIAASGTVVTATSAARPLHYAALPPLATGPDELVSCISLSAVAEGLALFLGPIIAGIATQALGTWSVVVGCTVAAALMTAMVIRLPLDTEPPAHAADEKPIEAALSGIAALRGDTGAIALLVVLTTNFVFIGALDVLGVAFSEDVLGLGHSGSGLLIGAAGVGAFIGAAIAASFVRRRNLTPVVLVSGVILGLGMAAVVLFSVLPPAMASIAVGGLAGSLLMVAGRTLLQRATDDTVLARVFAVAESTSLLGLALGSALAPLLVSALSASLAFVPLGLGIAGVTLVGVVFVRALDKRAVFRPVEMELLRSVPFLAVLPPYERERLVKKVSWVEVAPGTTIVTEGEPGRDFFIVAEGQLDVEVHGQHRVPLEAPGWFGEIALLQDVPRTATVRAVTRARLLRLSAPDFLAAVTGDADGSKIAREVTAAHLARDARATFEA